jgi:diguanylate cyclase (GGDEF)-like protein
MREACNPGHILIVEDDITLRTMLKLQLERAGYCVRTAEDGEEALRQIEQELPDLVLLDVVMPKLDGYETCHRIKSQIRTANVPVIMLTSRAEAQEKIRGLRGGANDYVTKPYEPAELLERVRNMLTWSLMQREANPLTGLPGNISIENEVLSRIRSGEKFCFMYIDIDNFKAFNDHYSFRRGDEAIKLTASILVSALSLEGEGEGFVGHVGGDDFVLISTLEHAEAVADAIIEEFDRKLPKLYARKDRERSCIESIDRRGNPVHFPLMTVTIAAVTNRDRRIEHFGELSARAAELKAYGKDQPGSVVIWDRRRAA